MSDLAPMLSTSYPLSEEVHNAVVHDWLSVSKSASYPDRLFVWVGSKMTYSDGEPLGSSDSASIRLSADDVRSLIDLLEDSLVHWDD